MVDFFPTSHLNTDISSLALVSVVEYVHTDTCVVSVAFLLSALLLVEVLLWE